MTLITFQDGKAVMRAGKVGTGQPCCCQCDPCSLCHSPCLSVTFSGFAGNPESQCDECDHLDGTYVLHRGQGYQPEITLAVKAKNGYGAVLTPTIGYDNSDGSYSITGVTIDKKGTCYSDDAQAIVKIIGGFVACGDDPLFSLTVGREEPLIDLNDTISQNGSGAELTPVYAPAVTTPGSETWSLDSVVVNSAGIGYDNLGTVFIKLEGCTVEVSPAAARVRTKVTSPVQDATYIETKDGTGANLSVTWSPASLPPYPQPGHLDGVPHWYPVISASGGSGYKVNDNILVTLSPGHFSGTLLYDGDWIVGLVSAVDQNGAITDVFTITTILYHRSDGSIDSIEVLDGGEYYTPGGIESATVLNPGTIWPDEACRYTLCEPTICEYGYPAEAKCRTISLLAASDGYHLTVSLSPDDSSVYAASLPPEGNTCSSLEFTPETITSSACATDGTATVTGGQCDGPPPEESCCKPPCETVWCPAECDGAVVVVVEWCGMTVEITLPIPGSSGSISAPNPPPGSYMIVDASIVCGCDDWLLVIGVCAYCAETNQFVSDAFFGTIAFSGNEEPGGGYCPEPGPVALSCFGEQFGIPCITTATATVS